MNAQTEKPHYVIQSGYTDRGKPIFLTENGTPIKFESYFEAVEQIREKRLVGAEVRTFFDEESLLGFPLSRPRKEF